MGIHLGNDFIYELGIRRTYPSMHEGVESSSNRDVFPRQVYEGITIVVVVGYVPYRGVSHYYRTKEGGRAQCELLQ
jgi:hypothetical protein